MMSVVLKRLRRAAVADGFGVALVLAASVLLATWSWAVIHADGPSPQLVARLDPGP